MSSTSNVYFICVKVKGKLRIRITSPGYNQEANCQFPRAIRKENYQYRAPDTAVSFARGPAGKFFYRVKKNLITTLGLAESDNVIDKVKINKIYADEDPTCRICLDLDREVVIVPCGHYCLCKDCADQIVSCSGKCPMCRGKIQLTVTRDKIQV